MGLCLINGILRFGTILGNTLIFVEELKAVSFFYDIGRSNFAGYSRSNSEYIDNFVKFFSEIEIELLLITSADLKSEIEETISKCAKNFKTHITYLLMEFSQFQHTLSSFEVSSILESTQMELLSIRSRLDTSPSNIARNGIAKAFSKIKPKSVFDLLPIKNSPAPEYAYPEYLRLIWLKPTIVKLAFESNFASHRESVAFLDFGIGHGNPKFISRMIGSKLSIVDSKWITDKLILVKRLPGSLTINPWDYAKLIDDAYVPAGFFISNYKSAMVLSVWWNSKIITLSQDSIVVDDQTLMAIYSAEQPDAIQFIETFDDENLQGLEKWLPIIKFTNKNEAS
jgi:hypothetical protein